MKPKLRSWQKTGIGFRLRYMDAVTDSSIARDFDTLFSTPLVMKTLARNGVFAIDYRNNRAFANELWLSWGYTVEDMLTGTILDIVHPEDRETIASHYHRLLSGEEDFYTGEYRIRTKPGRTVWVSVSYEVLEREEDGKPVFFLGHDEDVTALHEAQDEIRTRLLEIETLKDLIEGIHQSLDLAKTIDLVMDHLQKVIRFDRASVQLVEGDCLHVIGTYGFRDRMLPDLRFPIKGMSNPPARALETKKTVICNNLGRDFPDFVQVDPEVTIRSWLGIPLVVNEVAEGLLAIDSFQPGYYTEQHVILANTVARQIAMALEHAHAHRHVSIKAETDKLTGIANRYGLDGQGQALFRVALQEGTPLGLLLVDIDRFKVTNDRHGHEHGDKVLGAVSAVVAGNLRGDDFPVRYGGDEFVILLPGANIQEAFSIAERIRLRIAYSAPDEKGVAPTVSIGVHSGIPSEKDELHEYIACADRAMYEAKKMGRNRSCISAESLKA